MVTTQPERQHRIGLLLEYSGGTIAVAAIGLYIASLFVPPGSPVHRPGQRVAAAAVLVGGLTFLLGLAIHLTIHRRGLALAIFGAAIAWPAAVLLSILYLDVWTREVGIASTQGLLVLYATGLGSIALSLTSSVRRTTTGTPGENDVPTDLNRKFNRLTEQTEELHADSLRARDARHRPLAIALAGTGSTVVLVGILLGAHGTATAIPSTTVIVVGGIGLFTGLFLYYVTPERFVTATVATALCRTLDSVSKSFVEDATTPLYAYASGSTGEDRVHLELSTAAVSTDGEGTLHERYGDQRPPAPESTPRQMVPSGLSIYREIGPTPPYSEGSTRERILRLAETLNSPLGLVDDVDATWESDRLVVRIANSTCGPIDRFDHPVPSLLACGLAVETESKVVVGIERLDATDYDWQVACRQLAETSPTEETDTTDA